MKTFAVIGAGITGVTTANALLDRGFEVEVFDRRRYAGMETSFANGGQISASNAEVWNRWSTVLKGLRWMLSADAPLLVNPRPSWRKYRWMAEFMANIPRYRAHTLETVRLALAARAHLRDIAAREGIDFDCERRGILHVHSDRRALAHAAEVTRLLAEGGLERRAVGPEEIREIEPALVERFVGGFFTETDFTGDIHRFTRGLAEASARRGARFRYGAGITRLRRTPQGGVVAVWEDADGSVREQAFDGVVICAGVASPQLAAQLGDRVNIYPVKGYSITVALDDPASQAAAPWVSILDDEAKIVTSRLGVDRFRIAGTAEFNGENRDIRDDRIRPLAQWCERMFPDVSTEHAIPWAGLRPMTPSMLPRVGAGRRPGVFYNTGHGHLGWTLAAATAEIVADAARGAADAAVRRPRPALQTGPVRPVAA